VKPIHRNVLAGIAVLLLATLFVRLGVWQLDRLHQRRARNAAWTRALALPALPLDSARWAAIDADAAAYLYRRVRVRGAYDPAGQVLLRSRSMDGRPGVHVVTRMDVAGTPYAVMVNRGWTYAPDGAAQAVPTPPPAGTVEVEGVLLEISVSADRGMPSVSRSAGTPVTTLRHLDLATLRARSPRPLLALFVQQLPPAGTDDRTAALRRVPLPELDEGPHLSYAVQWFAFAAIALVGYLVLVLRRRDPGGR
jgi:surfeit locus 1 family protein